MVLYISGKSEIQALKNALGWYLLQSKGDLNAATVKILARAITCEMKQRPTAKRKTAVHKGQR